MRTTVGKVQTLLGGTTSITIVELCVDMASAIIDGMIVSNPLVTDNYSEDLLAQIELWLSAHLYASRPKEQVEEDQAGPIKRKYRQQTGLRLNSTSYGSNLLLLDHMGYLQDLNRDRRKAKVTWVGTDHTSDHY